MTLVIPYLYGALGADAYILRETTQQLHTREFDPRRIPENRARFLLGTLSGGVMVLFVDDNGAYALKGAAAGFLAGYSTDFLFNTIERMIKAS